LLKTAIDTRRQNGAWTSVARGTYVIAGAPSTWEQRAMIAVLASGPGAVVSHLSAAALLQFIDVRPTIIDVTVPHARRPRKSPLRSIHRTRVLADADRTKVGPIPVTTPARTMLDVAAILDEQRLEAALDVAITRGKTTDASRCSKTTGGART
jgi:predicted transcriptional regulator of viral defense system